MSTITTRAAIARAPHVGWEITLYDIPMLLGLYKSGQLKLDELVTRKYTLDQVNQAYQDMNDGKNIRGVIVHEH